MPRFAQVAGAVTAAWALAACGSVRTELPTSVAPAAPLQATPVEEPTLATLSTEPAVEDGPATSLSSYKSPGEKHPLVGGTLAASYPRVGVRSPRGAPPPPDGQQWAVLNVRFCAGPQGPVSGELVDPARFRIEVPGQGLVDPATDPPALAPSPLVAGTAVPAGTCTEGSIAFLVGGEGHVESTTYDSGDGLLRWAT